MSVVCGGAVFCLLRAYKAEEELVSYSGRNINWKVEWNYKLYLGKTVDNTDIWLKWILLSFIYRNVVPLCYIKSVMKQIHRSELRVTPDVTTLSRNTLCERKIDIGDNYCILNFPVGVSYLLFMEWPAD